MVDLITITASGLTSRTSSITSSTWEEFAGRNLLKSSGGEHIIYPGHCEVNFFALADITNVKLYFIEYIRALCLKVVTHIVPLLLITAQDANLFNITV